MAYISHKDSTAPKVYLNIQFIPHSTHTHLSYKNQSVMLYVEIIVIYSENLQKNT